MKQVKLPNGYIPTEGEEFMNPMQLEYFKQKLLKWRQHITREYGELVDNLKEITLPITDLTDRACDEEEVRFDLTTKERALKLIRKIDYALSKIEKGTYGYCEVSGEPISIERLKARPVATMSLESQEKHERYEREHVG